MLVKFPSGFITFVDENKQCTYETSHELQIGGAKQASPEGYDNDEDGEFHTTIKKQIIDV